MKTKLRIAVYHNLPSGGGKRATYDLIKRLSDKHDIDLFVLSTADKDFCDLMKYVKKTKKYDFSLFKRFNFPLSRLNWIIQFFETKSMLSVLKKIAGEINAGNYDIVFTTTCQFTEIPFIIEFLKGPVVYYSHSTVYPKYLFEKQQGVNSFRKIIKKILPDIGQFWYESFLNKKKYLNIQKSNMVFTNSYFMREQLYSMYGVWAVVNYLGIDFEVFKPDSAIEKENLILSVGALQVWKAHDFVIRSVSLIPENIRPILGIVCHSGSGGMKDILANLAKEKKVQLKFYENILKTQDMVTLYNKAKVCAFTPVFEPFGLVPLESMSCGTPVVGVKEGGIRETVVDGKTGFLVDRNPEKFAAAIQYLLENKNVAGEYGQQGRKHIVENWSWEKSTAELERHFYNIVSDSNKVNNED